MDRLQVLCFAGTYGLALVSDLARVAVKSSARWYLTVGLTLLGLVVHTAFLANLAWTTDRWHVLTVFESLLTVAWLLAVIDLYLIVRAPRRAAVGVFVLPLVLALSVVAGFMPKAEWTEPRAWVAFWGTVHGLFLLAGSAASCLAFAAGVMYLIQANRLKHKRRATAGIQLPSLEQSERLNQLAITIAFPLLTCGIGIGLILALTLKNQADSTSVLSWKDPKLLSGVLMWAVFAILTHARYKFAMRGRRVMVLTMLAFGFLVFALVGVDLLLPTAHGVPASTAEVAQ